MAALVGAGFKPALVRQSRVSVDAQIALPTFSSRLITAIPLPRACGTRAGLKSAPTSIPMRYASRPRFAGAVAADAIPITPPASPQLLTGEVDASCTTA